MGLAEGFISPYSGRQPAYELSTYSVLYPAVMHERFLAPLTHARKRSAYDIDQHNAWIRLLFQCIQTWTAAIVPFIETVCFNIFQLYLLVCFGLLFFLLLRGRVCYQCCVLSIFIRSNLCGLFFQLHLFYFTCIPFLYFTLYFLCKPQFKGNVTHPVCVNSGL